jgi:hypothetical protein
MSEVATKEPKARTTPPAEKVWRVEIHNTPVSAFGRIHRTQKAASEAEAWEKFKAAVAQQIAGIKDEKARAIHGQNYAKFLSDCGGNLPPRGRVIPEDEAVKELERSRLTAPPDAMR